MTRYADRYPKLGYFFGAYFHQDWVHSGSFENVIQEFMAENPAATVSQAAQELEELMGLELSENELEEIVVDDLGANVNPAGRGRTYRQWLQAVLDVLEKRPRA